MITVYQAWNEGKIGNFGSFQTTILTAFRLADQTNQFKLMAAYPEWFKVLSKY